MSVGDKLIIQRLENKIRELSFSNENYKNKIINLQNIFNNLESQIQNLKIIRQDYKLREEIYEKEKLEVEQKKQKIIKLEGDIINLQIEHEKYKNKKELEFETDINSKQNIFRTIELEKESSEVVKDINKKFYKQILELEEILANFKEEQRKIDEIKELDFENRMNDMKKKMLDYIKEGQKSRQYLSDEQLRLNDKLSLIHKNTLLNELDFQSMQLEDLLKQREHLDKIIVGMKSDIEIHKKIEKLLTQKNKQYTDMIKVLSTKVESKKKEKENEKDNNNYIEKYEKINVEPINKNKRFKFWKSNQNFIRITNRNIIFNEYNKRNINLENLIKSQSYTNDSNKFKKKDNKFRKFCGCLSNSNLSIDEVENVKDIVHLRKELIRRIKESEDYKSKYECYKTKLDILNNKYGNIMKLFEDVLIKIYEDKNMAYIKNIYINLEDFKSCNFEKLSSEEKYSIVILMIKYLLPLINPNNLPDKFKSLFSNIENVEFINDNNNYLLNSTSYNTSCNYRNPKQRHNVIKSRIKSSSSDFGKTQIFFDNKFKKFYRQINGITSNNNSHNKNEKLPKDKKITNQHFLKFINSQGNKKGFGKTGFTFKYSSLLNGFFKSLEAETNNNNNQEFKRSYSLFNI